MPKSQVVENSLDSFLEEIFGTKRDGTCCVICKSTAIKPEDFKDDLSRKEFTISYMCQSCQDEAFADPEED